MCSGTISTLNSDYFPKQNQLTFLTETQKLLFFLPLFLSFFLFFSFPSLTSFFLLIVGVDGYCYTWPHSVTPALARTYTHTDYQKKSFWTRFRSVAETAQHSQQSDIHALQQHSNPQPQHASGRRPVPQNAQPLGSSRSFCCDYKYYFKLFVTKFVLQGRVMAQTVAWHWDSVTPSSTRILQFFLVTFPTTFQTPIHLNINLIKRQPGAIWEHSNKEMLFGIKGNKGQKSNFTLLSSSRVLTV